MYTCYMRPMKRLAVPGIFFFLMLLLNLVYLLTSDPGNVSFFFLLLLFLLSGGILFCRWRYGNVPFWRGTLRKAGNMLIIAGLSVYFLVSLFLLLYAWSCSAERADYLLVLGAGLRGSRPTQVLVNRLERARKYLLRYPGSKAILCGGRGRMEDVSEARAMRDWLAARGISSGRLIMEDRSRTTKENLRNAAALLGEKGKTATLALLTSEFHLFRAGYYAGKSGLKPGLFSAPSPWYLLPSYLFREQLAIVKALIFSRFPELWGQVFIKKEVIEKRGFVCVIRV